MSRTLSDVHDLIAAEISRQCATGRKNSDQIAYDILKSMSEHGYIVSEYLSDDKIGRDILTPVLKGR